GLPGRMNREAFMNHKKLRWLAALPVALPLTAMPLWSAAANQRAPASSRPDLEYLKAVNQAAPPKDPQLLFLLMAQYASANRHAEGAEFFSARLKEFDPQLTDVQKALYLSAIAMLRAQHAKDVTLLHRVAWVKETVGDLERA